MKLRPASSLWMERRCVSTWLVLLIWLFSGCGELRSHSDTPVPLTPKPGYELYFTGPELESEHQTDIIHALVDLIDCAQVSIKIAVYQMDLKEVETSLIAARKRGVDVTVVTDSDSLYSSPSFIGLADEGIPVYYDRRAALMHHKFMIIDSHILWTGSWNFTTSGSYEDNNNALLIYDSRLANIYDREFDELVNFYFSEERSPASDNSHEIEIDSARISTCFSPHEGCNLKVQQALKKTHRNVYFMLFSLSEPEICQSLIDLTRDGYSVNGILEKQMAMSTYSCYGELIEAGADIILDKNEGLFHHKVMIIDEHLTLTGSYNFSRNASQNNNEILLFIDDEEIARKYLEEYYKYRSVFNSELN